MRRGMLSKDILYLFNSNILSKFLLFSGQLFVFGMLTPSELGVIKSSLAYIEILSVISIFGINTAVLFKSNINEASKHNEITAQNALIFSFSFSCIISCIVFVFLNLYNDQNNLVISQLLEFIWLLPLLAIITTLSSVLQSLQRYKEIMVVTVVPKIISIFILIMFTYYFSVNGYVYGYYIGIVISCIFIVYPVNKVFRKILFSLDVIKQLLSVGFSAMLSNLVGIISVNIGLIFLNLSSVTKSDIGQYSFALLIYFGCEVITQTVQQYFLPRYSQIKNDFKQWQILVRSSEKVLICFAVLISVIVTSISYVIYIYIPGFKYNHAMLLLSLMSMTWFFSSFYSLRGASFISLGLTKINLKASMILFVINIPTSYLLIMSFHVYGALLSRFIIVIINIFVIRFFFSKLIREGFNVKVYS